MVTQNHYSSQHYSWIKLAQFTQTIFRIQTGIVLYPTMELSFSSFVTLNVSRNILTQYMKVRRWIGYWFPLNTRFLNSHHRSTNLLYFSSRPSSYEADGQVSNMWRLSNALTSFMRLPECIEKEPTKTGGPIQSASIGVACHIQEEQTNIVSAQTRWQKLKVRRSAFSVARLLVSLSYEELTR